MTENDQKIEKAQEKAADKPTVPDPEAKKADSLTIPPTTDKAASEPVGEAGNAEDKTAADAKPEAGKEAAKPAAPVPADTSKKTAPAADAPADKPAAASAAANPAAATPAVKDAPKPADNKEKPAAEAAKPAAEAASPPAAADKKKEKSGKGMLVDPGEAHVLVVEDNVPNFVLIARMLAYMGIQRCEWKTSGWQVVEFADTLPRIDLILMDIRLPYEDGFQALEKVRANPRLKDTLVVAVTAEASVEQIKRAKEAGFDGFLGKPLDPDRFPDQIKRVLSGEPVWELH